ncbi:TFP11-domain-containing protein [Atractiella rhizophila]|nr:TFP11-domain-containing protein [Atractiella rhizophila]
MRGASSSSSSSSSNSDDESDREEEAEEKRIPRDRQAEQEEDEEKPRMGMGMGARGGGIGMGGRPSLASMIGRESGDNTPTSRMGMGMGGRASLASFLARNEESPSSTPPHPSSSAGIGASQPPPERERRAFLGAQSSPATTPRPNAMSSLTREEKVHFAKLQSKGGAALKMMEKMGWKAGEGLGKEGAGRVTPVMSTLRPKGMGLAYEGFREKGKAATVEEKRKEEKMRKEEKEKEKEGKKENWTRGKLKKRKVEHRTYEQILALEGGGGEGRVDSSLGVIIDATGSTLKELPSLPSSLSFVPTHEETSSRLPELTHNLSLILSQVSGDLKGFAREGQEIRNRRAYLEKEEERLKSSLEEAGERRARLEGAMTVVGRLVSLKVVKETDLEQMDEPIRELLGLYPDVYAAHALDEVVVAALSAPLKRMWTTWDPLQKPDLLCRQLAGWKNAFRLGNSGEKDKKGKGKMTAFESLMWNSWLPKVRSAINNRWDPSDSTPVIELFKSHAPILPSFISDNFIAQLLIPKLLSSIASWNPRSPHSLASVVLPWLEVVGERPLEPVVEEAKRKVAWWMKGWRVRDGFPSIGVWKGVMSRKEWEDLIVKYVLPQLGKELRDKFSVNPREQNLDALEQVLLWKELLRGEYIDQLLEKEFWPKWIDALYTWLVADPNTKEIADWYDWWKDYFGEDINSLPGFKHALTKARDLINQAMALKGDAKHRLKRPDPSSLAYTPPPKSSKSGAKKKQSVAQKQVQEEISFKQLIEEVAEENELVMLPTGRAEEKTGSVIYRLGTEADRKGVMLYIHDEVAWVREKEGSWRPVGVEELMKLGKGM